jgi:glycosyltransferase involved in cell wall biosynthesis
MISVLIPTCNEASNILDCLRSVAWANEIVVVDSRSTDDTRAIASGFGARVVDFAWDGRWPKKKNWALENIAWRNEWLLILDADERITASLAREIRAATVVSPLDGYFINRRFLFMGRWIRHCGYYPSWNLRLFRHAAGRYEKLLTSDTGSGDNEIHEHLIVSGPTGSLQHDMLHLAYPDIFIWVEKHNRYSNWEAHVELSGERRTPESSFAALGWKRSVRWWSRRAPFRPALRFLYHYVLRRGFLDGYEGYVLCRLLGMYELLTVFKKRELRGAANRKVGMPYRFPSTSSQPNQAEAPRSGC